MSFQELIAIRDEARQMAQEDQAKPMVDCPIDGATLQFNPKRNIWNCPMGNYSISGGAGGAVRMR